MKKRFIEEQIIGFPSAEESPVTVNEQAQQIAKGNLTNSAITATQRNTGRFGQVTDIVVPDDRGVRYNAKAKFIGFLEPPKK
ncbi:hypothetical protein [Azospira inquinata]|uniref:Uncharacterized protein n=1 Tax=Azospira inquinata TaxID=2785627 RepID=A0A975SPB8_9RHOO|nr:hypothetical protein [Azospira inquinata]QWT47340.1 hypothetical protein J8L76_06475 [Azospira inquinata]QWT50035.1 hypothetical protein Azoinq_05400 [Azospira inquinata]